MFGLPYRQRPELSKVNYADNTGAKDEADKFPDYIGAKEAQNILAIRNTLHADATAIATFADLAEEIHI